jgi:predicted nuclease of predicted toxin-antitoxin system
MKFHTDERVSEAVALGLRRRGLDVTTTQQAGLIGARDEMQLSYCRREGRVMVSHDADMLRFAAAGISHAGIAYCHNQRYKTGELILRLLALSGRVAAEDMQNRVEFL